ncbi:azurin [Methylophaga sp.]|uniref:azurin n=1 Tax=Methylophaga sp. TaxID=2024840 RepID=UPI0027216B8C|nr:azurin [Methylophaga sp.]MDO8825156.1 azurin [Methylophaga sp.]
MRFYLLLPLAVTLLPMVATANECEVSISAGDGMSFNTRTMDIPMSCEQFTVNFEHTGRLPKGGMGHNWVMTQSSDVQAVVAAGTVAGIANNYLPADDSRVVAATPLLGGGEKASVTFETSLLSADSSYTFFCSFPGHSAMMRGSVNLVE